MDFKDLLEQSWKSFMEFIGPLIVNTLVLALVSFFTIGILAPVCTAGYMQSILLAIRENRKPEVGDLFSHMNLFLPLLGFTIVAGIALMIGFAMLFLPGIIVGIALVFFCIYMLPLMTDKELGLIDAVKESSRMALEDPITDQIVVVLLFIVITTVGNSIVIGFLFTQPLATLLILYAFEEKCGGEETQPEKKEEPAAAAPPPPPPKPEAEEAASETGKEEAPTKPEEDKTSEKPEEKE